MTLASGWTYEHFPEFCAPDLFLAKDITTAPPGRAVLQAEVVGSQPNFALTPATPGRQPPPQDVIDIDVAFLAQSQDPDAVFDVIGVVRKFGDCSNARTLWLPNNPEVQLGGLGCDYSNQGSGLSIYNEFERTEEGVDRVLAALKDPPAAVAFTVRYDASCNAMFFPDGTVWHTTRDNNPDLGIGTEFTCEPDD